jgi:hypothetical protein
MASGGSIGKKARKLAAALTELEQEGGSDVAAMIRELVQVGAMSLDSALEAIEAGETLGKARAAGEVTDEQASDLISQMAERHATGRRG